MKLGMEIAPKQRGFTLLEVMMVVVIVGILVGLGLPAYQESVRRGYRSTAQGDLLAAAQAMEKDYALFFHYGSSDAGSTFPDTSPLDSDNPRYRLSVERTASTSVTTFRVRATPIPGAGQADDGLLEINHLGQRFWDKNNDGDVEDAGENNWDRD